MTTDDIIAAAAKAIQVRTLISEHLSEITTRVAYDVIAPALRAAGYRDGYAVAIRDAIRALLKEKP